MDKFTITTARAILAAALVTSAGVAMAESSARSNVTNIAATARCAGANTTANPANCDKPVSTNRKAGGDPNGTQVQLNPQPLPPGTGNPSERKAGGDPSGKNTAIIIEGHTTPNTQTRSAVTK